MHEILRNPLNSLQSGTETEPKTETEQEVHQLSTGGKKIAVYF